MNNIENVCDCCIKPSDFIKRRTGLMTRLESPVIKTPNYTFL